MGANRVTLKRGITDMTTMSLGSFDLETTGIDPFTARIVQTGIVTHSPGEDYQSTALLVNPDCDIPLEASAVHGISTEHAQTHGLKISEVIPALLGSFADLKRSGIEAVCIFNASYDLTVLSCEMERNGFGTLSLSDIGLPIIDPLISDRRLDTYRRGRRTLTAISSAYGVVVSKAHQADGDCITTIKLARAMGKRFPGFRYADLDSLQLFQSEAHREFARQFELYKRQEEPDFKCSGDWPIMGQSK